MKRRSVEDIILNILETECDFNDLNRENFHECVGNPFRKKYQGKVFVEYGVTKGVLIFPLLDIVIKIPFTGDEDDYFCGAECPNEWDYCEVEENIYKEAKIEGVEKFFAKTEFLTYIKGHPIYKQDYVPTLFINSQEENHSHLNFEKEVNKFCEDNDFYCFNIKWLADSYAYYGEAKTEKLLFFINEMGIEDLHHENIGYIGKRPILIDYSSFHS